MPGVDAGTILNELMKLGDPEQARIVAGYLKTSSLTFLGVRLPVIARVARGAMRGREQQELVELMSGLWSEPVYEARRAAVDIMKEYAMKGDPERALHMIDEWINDIDTWAILDPIGSNCLGALLLRRPEIEEVLVKWSKDTNLWKRRASILPYLYLSLKQNYRPEYNERILRAVKPHISDNEFFVGKAAGWVIRELSKRDPATAGEFIDRNRDSMTSLVVREASKKL